MRRIINIEPNIIVPDRYDVFASQGIGRGEKVSENVEVLLNKAMGLFQKSVDPISIISEISKNKFETIYKGEGWNEKNTPLSTISKKADALALFAVTIGEKITRKIDRLFKSDEFALGHMLDAVASVGTEKAAEYMVNFFLSVVSKKKKVKPLTKALSYSPGYCGWHVSGQRKLFEVLQPERIGISLLNSFLMKPLKSISGVIVIGKREIHIFDDNYSFCGQCRTHSCRARIKLLLQESESKNNH
jgi:hypothetical protein